MTIVPAGLLEQPYECLSALARMSWAGAQCQGKKTKNLATDFEELRQGIERLRALLETLVVRGLRACGSDELLQLQSFTEYLDQAGAGHVAAVLASLHSQIEKDERESATSLLDAQICVRLLERLLTLRIVKGQYQAAIARLDAEAAGEIEKEDE
jgi:hypothetical protein